MARFVCLMPVLVLSALMVGCSGPTATPADAEPPAAVAEAETPAEALVGDEVTAEAPSEGLESTEAPAAATPAPTSISDPVGVLTDTLTYSDPEIGYEIDYPATWSINAVPGSIVTVTSFDPEVGGSGAVQPGDTRIDIVPDLAQVETTFEALVEQTTAALAPISIEQWELEGGVPASRLHLSTPGTVSGETLMLLTMINGRGVRVEGFGDLSWFDPIARSLRQVE